MLNFMWNEDPLALTAEQRDGEREPRYRFYLYRPENDSEWRIVTLTANDGEPVWFDRNRAIKLPNGADPEDLGLWAEGRGELLARWINGEIPNSDVEAALHKELRVHHAIDYDGSYWDETRQEWVRQGCPGTLEDFILDRMGAEVVPPYIRYQYEEDGVTVNIWTPKDALKVQGKVARAALREAADAAKERE